MFTVLDPRRVGKRLIWLFSVAWLSVLWITPIHAQGINFAFDDCGAAGTDCKSFLCDANTGPSFPIIASFVPPPGITDFVGVSAYIDIKSSTAAIPHWWKHGVGQCRGTAGLFAGFDFTTGPFTCVDATFGYGAGGFAYDVGVGGPDHAWLRVTYAIPIDLAAPLDPGLEYYSFRVGLLRSKTTGAGSCVGCDVPMTLTLDSLRVFQKAEIGFDPLLTTPLVNNVVTWQGPSCPPTHQISIDARELSEPTILVSNSIECLDASVVQPVELVAGSHHLGGCISGGQVAFEIDGDGNVNYAPALEGLLSGAGTSTLVVHGYPIDVDAQAIPGETWRLNIDPTCLSGGEVESFRLLPGTCTFAFCSGDCPHVESLPGMSFSVDGSGLLSYAPILEGVLTGAGTATLVVSSPPFPPAGDETALSLGKFRIVVEPEFWELMNGYPGYGVVNGLHRLTSPLLLDFATTVGRSNVHRHGDATDLAGTPVGTAGTVVSDADFAFVPPGFQGPDETLELHTEVRSLNLRNYGMTFALRAGVHAPDRPISAGEIEANPDADGLFPAQSFFDVFMEVDLPVLGTLYNVEPLLVENSDITCFPPEVIYLSRHTGPVEMAFKQADTEVPPRWSAGQRFGWMVVAGLASNFDTTGAMASWVHAEAGVDPFEAFEQVVTDEPEMSEPATVVVDVEDVVTFSSDSSYVDPVYRDSVLAGIDAAAAFGQAGDPCAGIDIVSRLYGRLDGLADPVDWVDDPALRTILSDRVHELGHLLVNQANETGGCLVSVPAVEPSSRVAIVGIQPNPTLGLTRIRFAIPVSGPVNVSIYDLAGRLVQKLVDAELPAGTHQVVWDGRANSSRGHTLSTGTYFVRLKAAGETAVKRVSVVK